MSIDNRQRNALDKIKELHTLIDKQSKKWIDASKKCKTYYKIENMRMTLVLLNCAKNLIQLFQLWDNRNNEIFDLSIARSDLTENEIKACFRFRNGKNHSGKSYESSGEEFDLSRKRAIILANEIRTYLNSTVFRPLI